MPSLMKDEELMVAYQQGSESAFADLYERYSARVYGYLFSHLRDRALSDDAFQSTFMKLHSSRAKYDPKLPFAPWLFTICRSTAVDTLRARKRIQSNEILDEAATFGAATPAAVSVAPSDLGSLPPAHREALELRYREDLSFEEIARRLNVTPTNSRQLVSRALRKLRNLARTESAREEIK